MKKYPYIFLTGCMGSGKTTVGSIVAKKLGRPFIDLDKLIEKRAGMSINKIFKERGEEGFRKLETEVLKDLPHSKAVVATGGGVVIKEENRDYMKDTGAVLWLDISAERLAKRLRRDHSRPLLNGKDKKAELERLIEERRPYYEDCTYRVEAEELTPLQCALEIVKFMKA